MPILSKTTLICSKTWRRAAHRTGAVGRSETAAARVDIAQLWVGSAERPRCAVGLRGWAGFPIRSADIHRAAGYIWKKWIGSLEAPCHPRNVQGASGRAPGRSVKDPEIPRETDLLIGPGHSVDNTRRPDRLRSDLLETPTKSTTRKPAAWQPPPSGFLTSRAPVIRILAYAAHP